jgi:hypothetical protein
MVRISIAEPVFVRVSGWQLPACEWRNFFIVDLTFHALRA